MERRQPRLADAARPRRLTVDDVHVHFLWIVGHPRHVEVGVVGLLHGTVLVGDAAIKRVRHAHDGRALDLRADTFWVDAEAAIDCGVDFRHPDRAVFVDLHPHDGRNRCLPSEMRGDAEPFAVGQFLTPTGFFGRHVDRRFQPCRIDGELGVGIAVVPEVFREP